MINDTNMINHDVTLCGCCVLCVEMGSLWHCCCDDTDGNGE